MDLTAEAPTHFRSTGVRPGVIGLVREGVVEVLGAAGSSATSSRRTSRRRAPTPSSATSGGSSTRSSRCRLRRPRGGHLPAADAGLPAVHLRRDPAVEVVHDARINDAITSVVEPGAADQADPVPEDRPAGRGAIGRDRELRVRADPARHRCCCCSTATGSRRQAPAHPGHRRGPVRVHAGARRPALGAQRLLPRHRQRRSATSCGCGSTCRRGCTRWTQLEPARSSGDPTLHHAR